jgi:hypothetical protein
VAEVKFAGGDRIKGIGRPDIIDEAGRVDDRDGGIH